MNTYTTSQKTVTIGTFDGVHLGHQKILKKVLEISRAKSLTPSVLTFFPHPRMVLQKEDAIQLLNTIDERIDMLKTFGIEDITIKPFTKDFATLTAEQYVKTILIKDVHAQYIVVGYDHRFGQRRSAGIEELRHYSKVYNFEVEEISAEDVNQVTISSTKIRNALHSGDIATANTYLGYTYFLTGQVVKGKSLGRTLGFPTANIFIKESYKLIPKDGVYVITLHIEGQQYYGMMNIGHNPTIVDKPRSIEVHIFDFNANIYEKTLKIELLHRLRDEQKFESLEGLKNQLSRDKENALQYIKPLS